MACDRLCWPHFYVVVAYPFSCNGFYIRAEVDTLHDVKSWSESVLSIATALPIVLGDD